MKRLQALLRAGFLQMEGLYNWAFTDRFNPLYHLGAITFFLFWVVAATGLYLYAFFETGVADAYASVQGLPQNLWGLGGLMRSVHRYASDAMVLAMVIHLLRHFAFDRFRGFRWFSWITGVALIWGVYASGVNGYMLPWDALAQFVTIASFEWLDWLPIFGGTLIRNFVHASSVNDRLFSLLAFMHIGVPLVVLLLMWVHVQRVPKADTKPPRPVALGLVGMLVVLALLQPVSSQGGAANMATAPTVLSLDWFYLALFPLVYQWPIGGVWALVLGLTLLLAALPWLGRRRRAAAEHFEVRLHEAGAAPFEARPGETLLEAGLRQGLALPYECRSGGCGVCRCTVLHGEVDPGVYQPAALPERDRAQGQVLMCCATPLSDLEIEVALTTGPREVPVFQGRVQSLQRLAPSVMRIIVALPPGQPLQHGPGQYINILLDDGQRRAFSVANRPEERDRVELHVRLVPGGRFTTHVFERMKVGDALRFEGPLGGYRMQESEHPMLLVAGATGFAPVKSIVEDAFQRGLQRPIRLYWGVRRCEDIYLPELPATWQREHPNFEWVPVISDEEPPPGWRRGLVHHAMLGDYPDLREHEVYVCGSARMVEAAVPAFMAQGLREGACASDAFLGAA
ncbi:MAG: 2Fe-2S iron-sulfur cluster-binding protein [Pseudomonadota bacterium]